MVSADEKLNELRDGSVVSHFISFSGVTPENSVVQVLRYWASLRWLAATAAPKVRPEAAAAAPSVDAAEALVNTAPQARAMSRRVRAVTRNPFLVGLRNILVFLSVFECLSKG